MSARNRRLLNKVSHNSLHVRRLSFEPLEDRRLLANVTVGNLNDVVNGTTTSIAALIATPGADGISLREAILAANADTAADVIDFAPSVTGTIQLTNIGHVGELAISNNLTINGPGAGALTIRRFAGTAAPRDGARIFKVDDGTFVTKVVGMTGLTISGGDPSASAADSGDGGGILNAEHLILADSVISGNAAFGGGGVANAQGLLTVTRCTIRDNHAGSAGGGVANSSGRLELVASTISGNTTGNLGGGIWSYTSLAGIARTIVQGSTISGNSSAYAGGGIHNARGSTFIYESTITANTADETAGVRSHQQNVMGERTLTLVRGSIIAGNFGADVQWSGIAGTFNTFYSEGYNVIGGGNALDAFVLPGDQTNVTNPLLGPLTYNGGPTRTHALLAGSPAINAGDPAVAGEAGQYDQRGAPYLRVFGGRIDVGAFERQNLGAPQAFIVDTLADELDGNNGPGDLSLREAIQLANVNFAMADAITFHASLAGTILLSLGELAVTDAVTIAGPGALLLTVDATGNDPSPVVNNGDGSHVLNIDDGDGSTLSAVTISGLTLTGADGEGFGAVGNRENLSVTECIIRDNSAGGLFNEGGGIRSFADANLMLTRSTISGNSAGSGGGVSNRGSLTIIDSTVSGNTAASEGGGIRTVGDLSGNLTVTIVGSTISGNTAGGNGGGVSGAGLMLIGHSTITNNTAPDGSGGGIASDSDPAYTRTEVGHTIIAGNLGSDVDSVFTAANTFQSNGYNLIGTGNAAGEFVEPGDQAGVANPMLGPLTENGGPTQTRALLLGSPAIDAGDPMIVFNPAESDQRGSPYVRVSGGRIDIGAYESQPDPNPVLVGDYNADGTVNAADYTIWRDTLGSTTDLRANGDASNNVIDTADYGVWKANFGETLGSGASGEERAANASIAGGLQAPPRGTDTPVRSSSPHSLRGGQEGPPHLDARMLALLELLALPSTFPDDAEFSESILDSHSTEMAEREAAFAAMEDTSFPSVDGDVILRRS